MKGRHGAPARFGQQSSKSVVKVSCSPVCSVVTFHHYRVPRVRTPIRTRTGTILNHFSTSFATCVCFFPPEMLQGVEGRVPRVQCSLQSTLRFLQVHATVFSSIASCWRKSKKRKSWQNKSTTAYCNYIYIRYKQVCLLFMFSHCWSKRFFCEAKKYRTSITSASVQRTPNRGHGIRPSWASQCGAGAGESRVGEPREGPGIRPASVRRRLGVRDVAKEWYSKCTCTVCIYKTIYHIYIY